MRNVEKTIHCFQSVLHDLKRTFQEKSDRSNTTGVGRKKLLSGFDYTRSSYDLFNRENPGMESF